MESSTEDRNYWIPTHPTKCWDIGRGTGLHSMGNETVTVCDSDDEEFVLKRSETFPVSMSIKPPEDLLMLPEFHEGSVLYSVRKRYFDNDRIYTAIGSAIIISVNPFKDIPEIYSTKEQDFFRSQSKEKINESRPHLYKIAAFAYHELFETKKIQSMIISGESGAGKTEATKKILGFLAGTSQSLRNEGSSKKESDGKVEKRVLKSNPLLEAFGNAKTVRNDNSSRFGKFIEIYFTEGKQIQGAKIQNYLLEKSRIVRQEQNERNYHIFYQILSVSEEKLRQMLPGTEKLYLKGIDEYEYLNESSRQVKREDAEDFERMVNCMEQLDFSEAERLGVLRIVSAILLLGNMEFGESGPKNEVSIADQDTGNQICELLGISFEKLNELCCFSTRMNPATKKRDLKTNLDESNCRFCRDTLATTIYTQLFDWLIVKVNQSILAAQWDEEVPNLAGKKAKQQAQKINPNRMIGLLDIFGFEHFKKNSFEQLCINYANEKLQQHFNKHMFAHEQKMYQEEGLNWKQINFVDNQETIDLLEKPTGSIFAFLHDNSRNTPPSDQTFVSQINKAFGENPSTKKPGNGSYLMQKMNNFFGVRHYAGEVIYDISNFCAKNKHQVNVEVQEVLSKASNPVLPMLFQGDESKGISSQGYSSICIQFRSQMQSLLKILDESNPSYIRCIKPNELKIADEFDSQMVLKQLKCAGILEAIRIRRAGYSVRRKHNEFLQRYQVLAPKHLRQSTQKTIKFIMELLENKKEYQEVIKKLNVSSGFEMGRTLVFMKDEVKSVLEDLLSQWISGHMLLIQRVFRGHRARNRVRKIRSKLFMDSLIGQVILRARDRFIQEKRKKLKRECFKSWLYVNRLKFSAAVVDEESIKQKDNKVKSEWEEIQKQEEVLRQSVLKPRNPLSMNNLREIKDHLHGENSSRRESAGNWEQLLEKERLEGDQKLSEFFSMINSKSQSFGSMMEEKDRVIAELNQKLQEASDAVHKKKEKCKNQSEQIEALKAGVLRAKELLESERVKGRKWVEEYQKKDEECNALLSENEKLQNLVSSFNINENYEKFKDKVAQIVEEKDKEITQAKHETLIKNQEVEDLRKRLERLESERGILKERLRKSELETARLRQQAAEEEERNARMAEDAIDQMESLEKKSLIKQHLVNNQKRLDNFRELVKDMSSLIKMKKIQISHLETINAGKPVSEEQDKAYKKMKGSEGSLTNRIDAKINNLL